MASCAVLECVINVSEGRDAVVVDQLASVVAPCLLDVHRDADHHRSVFTLGGPETLVVAGARALTETAVRLLDLRTHQGAHPRIGVVDVVPWVVLEGWPVHPGPLGAAQAARDAYAKWAAQSLDLPVFLYGQERTLPDIRRQAWRELQPDVGPSHPHPSAGAVAAGARPPLVAYNLWLSEPDLALARAIARSIRRPGLRTLGLELSGRAQVSCNLTDPWIVGPDEAFDAVAAHAPIARAELVGLLPRAVLHRLPPERWSELDIDDERTIEARLEAIGLGSGPSG
jgi:glutamate formiminotransferase